MKYARIRLAFLGAVLWSLHAELGAAEPAVTRPILVEAESFSQRGGWVVDAQFMDQMGSPYLLAHGLGRPVADATVEVEFPVEGTYRIWVRHERLGGSVERFPHAGEVSIARRWPTNSHYLWYSGSAMALARRWTDRHPRTMRPARSTRPHWV